MASQTERCRYADILTAQDLALAQELACCRPQRHQISSQKAEGGQQNSVVASDGGPGHLSVGNIARVTQSAESRSQDVLRLNNSTEASQGEAEAIEQDLSRQRGDLVRRYAGAASEAVSTSRGSKLVRSSNFNNHDTDECWK